MESTTRRLGELALSRKNGFSRSSNQGLLRILRTSLKQRKQEGRFDWNPVIQFVCEQKAKVFQQVPR
ncbi:hypothetical protein AAFF_G00089590 [Aldrovandia affinis]|uniref:Uncharacterized protein n=1 Tax=Aldrovandia affinis TaxID=143900 RepID=A0AAD7WCG6_9TELE|nr:hypothetical protein AAFF_G00089590 [Aldrovandia affinis]